ncbi:MAG: hypothetical protein II320_01660, partial [Oscillospiraceae bacterium]|nr:hypothetical protein [Oscillospiraceae bacterium]
MFGRSKRFVSLLLALTLIIGLIPVFEAEVHAATVYPKTWEELRSALETPGDAKVVVATDIEYTDPPYTLIGSDKSYDDFDTIEIQGNKVLSIAGSGSIYCKDMSGNVHMTMGIDRWMDNGTVSYLFRIPADAKLTVEGPTSAKIHFDGNAVGIHDYYNEYSMRHIFDVSGTLVVNGCTLEVGREVKQYVTAAEDSQVPALFTGYFYQQVIGYGIVVNSGGHCTINGGVINGRGTLIYNDQGASVQTQLAAVLGRSHSTVCINGGTFYGNGGAHVLDITGDCDIRGGRFQVNNGRDRTRLPDDDNNCIVGSYTSQFGQLNIPDKGWQDELSQMYVVEDGTIYNTTAEKESLSLVDGRGPVEFVPYPNQMDAASITYGTLYYEDGTTASMHEEWLSWNPFFGNVKLRLHYSNYYAGNVKDSQVKRIWKIWKGPDVSVDPAYTVTTINDEYLDLSTIAKTYDIGWHEADMWYIRCFIEETGPSGTVKRMGTYFLLEIGGLPMTQDELPDSLNMYPAYTNGGDSVQLTVYPTRDQMMDATSFLDLSSLYYKFSYVNADGTSVVRSSANGVITLNDLRYGTTSVRYDLVMQDNTGASKTFYGYRTLLRIPQISVTNGTLSNDGSQYIVPNGKADMSISGSGFTSSDIYGWYRLKEDGTYSKLTVSENVSILKGYPTGTYQVGVKDPTGAVVFSKPVVIASSDTYYALNITSDKTVITYDPTLDDQPEVTFNAAHGTGWKTEGYTLNTEWHLVGYPAGSEGGIKRFKWITTANTAYMRYFLDTSEPTNIVPGLYTVQARVKITAPDGTVTYQYTNAIDITVYRKTDGVEIRNDAGEVLGDAMEGPTVGNTLQLVGGPKDGGNFPTFTGFTFTLTDVVGEGVATITPDGLLTAHKPGRVKVTLTGSYRIEYTNGSFNYGSYTKDLYINIPITDYEVSFEMPKLGDDPSDVFQVPEDAPYTLDVHWEYMDEGDTFSGNQVPQCVLQFTPKPGYVNRLDAYEPEYYKNDWVENFNDLTLTINGETFDAYEVASWVGSSLGMGIISCEYINYGQSYVPYTLHIGYDKFERIIDPSHTYVEETSFQLTEPYVGDPRDISESEWVDLDCTCADAPNLSCAVVFLHKVSADTVYDGDIDNDDTVSMGADEYYEQDQWYRVGIAVSRDNLSYWLSEGMITTVNGVACYNDATEGDTHAIVYYYFTPEVRIETVEMVGVYGVTMPKAGRAPADLTTLYTDHDQIDVVYAAWFVDANGNGLFDEGEDQDIFDAYGNFQPYTSYGLFLVISSSADHVVLAEDVFTVVIDSETQDPYYLLDAEQGAALFFGSNGYYEYALEADTDSVGFRELEGYTTSPSQTVTLTSTGEYPIDAYKAYISSDYPYEVFQLTMDGMQVTVSPVADLPVGTYTGTLIIDGGSEYAHIEIPVTFEVIYGYIESIDITVEAPKSGSTPSFNVITNDRSQSIARVDYWYQYSAGFPELTPNDTFTCGKTYAMRVMVFAQSGYAINDDTVITVNGVPTTVYGIFEDGSRGVEVDFTTKHAMEYYEADPGTCVEPGHIAYFSCVYCGANYHDASGRQPVADEEMETGLGDHYYYDGKCYY